ncbi:MAG TPA: DHHA1 domain-containing protein, partial [Thermoanaerobaculaceae bacterium]|nr:DHHA1 domain-containing protein [Thermoanaerobaculaceae bacterium]
LTSEAYGEINYLDAEAPVVGAMIMPVADAASVAPTAAMATCLYTALVTDTGDFRYSNATPRAFAAAARLVEAGARPSEISEGLWGHTPARVIRLTAAILSTLELLAGGHIALITCDRATLERTGAAPSDTENLINIPRGIDGVEVAVLLKDFDSGTVRVSMRSRDRVDVQAVAARFGGGGHRAAAGCSVPGTLAEVRETILAALLHQVEVP